MRLALLNLALEVLVSLVFALHGSIRLVGVEVVLHGIEGVAFSRGNLVKKTGALHLSDILLARIPGIPAVRGLEVTLHAITLRGIVALPEELHDLTAGRSRVRDVTLVLVVQVHVGLQSFRGLTGLGISLTQHHEHFQTIGRIGAVAHILLGRFHSSGGITGAQAARKILDDNGLYDVSIERVGGHLTDHYDPKENVIRLSDEVYSGANAAAIGVAAHEAGHAVQYARDYFPIRVRAAIIPLTRIGAGLAMPLFLIGLFISYFYFQATSPLSDLLMVSGIGLYSFSTLFQLITLPVEFNASRRALRILDDWGTLTKEEHRAAGQVLSAAAMTYVAALATSLLSLWRLIFIFRRRR